MSFFAFLVSGTSRQHVADDYALQLSENEAGAQEVMTAVLADLVRCKMLLCVNVYLCECVYLSASGHDRCVLLIWYVPAYAKCFCVNVFNNFICKECVHLHVLFVCDDDDDG